MESFNNPIYEGIDSLENSPFKENLEVSDQKDMECQLQNQLQQELLKCEGLEHGLLVSQSNSDAYEDLKVEVLNLKNNLLQFQSKFDRQKSTNNQNFSMIELLKKELAQKSKEIQKLSLENLQIKTQISENPKTTDSYKPIELFRFSSGLDTLKASDNTEMLKKIKSLEQREKALGGEILKGYEERKILEDKIKDLMKESEYARTEKISDKGITGNIQDRLRSIETEKRGLLKELGDLRTSNSRFEELLNNEKENSKKKDVLIEKLSEEKAKIYKDMHKSYEENNQFIAQIELENQNHLLLLQQFQSKTSSYESRINELELQIKTQTFEIKTLKNKNEGLNEEITKLEPLENEKNVLKENNKKYEILIKELQDKVKKLVDELKCKDLNIEDKERDYKKEKYSFEQKIQNLESLYKSQCEHSIVISRNVDLVSEENRALKKTNLDLIAQIKSFESKKISQENEIFKIIKEKDSLKSLFDEKVSEIDRLQKSKISQNTQNSFQSLNINEKNDFHDSKLYEETLRLKSQLKEKISLNELLEKRVEVYTANNEDLTKKAENLENELYKIKTEKNSLETKINEYQRNLKDIETNLKDSQENAKILQKEKNELIQEKELLTKQIEAKSQLIASYQKHQEDFQKGFITQEYSEVKRLEELLLERTLEAESKETDILKMKELLSSQSFSLKTLNQTLQGYRDSLMQYENQIKSLETEKLTFESNVRVLKQEIEAFEEDKTKLRDILSISNKGKDQLLMELEYKDKLIEEMQRNQSGSIQNNIIKDPTPTNLSTKAEYEQEIKLSSPNKKKPIKKKNDDVLKTQFHATPKKKNAKKDTKKEFPKTKEFNLKEGIEEEMLYNEVLELSQEAIDLLKRYEQLVNSFHKAKKPVQSNLKDYIRPEIKSFFQEFQNILKKYTFKEISMREWLGCDCILKTNGPQETEINETLSNCKTFLLDFMPQEDFEFFFKKIIRKNLNNSHVQKLEIEGFDDIKFNLDDNSQDMPLKGPVFTIALKKIIEEISKKQKENSDFMPKDKNVSSRISEMLESIEGVLESEPAQSELYQVYNNELSDILGLIEQAGSEGGILIWLIIKRLQNQLHEKNQEFFCDSIIYLINDISSDCE